MSNDKFVQTPRHGLLKVRNMSPYSVMVTGANRGIGLGLVKELLKNKEIRHIIATAAIRPAPRGANIAVDKVEKIVGDKGLTVLVNNAGMWVKYFTNQEPNRADIIKNFDTNAASVAVLTQ
ncbi:hypothetical protein OSTOST_12839, partial [Ostertagia ostertagi]